MISYNRLWETMEKRKISQYRLIKRFGLSSRPDEPSEEEYICFDAYVGDALPDPGLPDRGCDGGFFRGRGEGK